MTDTEVDATGRALWAAVRSPNCTYRDAAAWSAFGCDPRVQRYAERRRREADEEARRKAREG